MAEFDGIRAQLYGDALREFPQARRGDVEVMRKYLAPQPGEVILEVGAGNGVFSGAIADAVLPNGKVIVTDPSEDQLDGVEQLKRSNIEIRHEGGDTLTVEPNSVDAIWSFGALHHLFTKSVGFQNFYKALKPGGRMLITDVFSGTVLAQHFDDRVAKYCITGHEVAFWSYEYAETLCFLNGFEKPEFYDFDAKWEFDHKEDIGVFLYKLHAMTKTTPEECLQGAEDLLGIEEEGGKFYLHYPLTTIVTKKKS